MQQVTQSPLLQALGYAILNSLWQFALLWLVYVVLNTLWKFTSHQKYVSGLVLQVAGFTWFIVTLVFYYNQCVTLADSLLQQQQFIFDLTLKDSATFREKVLLRILQTEQLLPYLSLAYLSLLVFLITKWLHAYRFTQTVRSSGLKKIDVEWRLFVQQLSFKLGISRSVKIYLSELVKTPLTIGFLKPLILIPIASINHLTAEQMEAVILHELAHIKRFDYLLNLFLAVIEAVMFFNLFMQLISIQIKRERENCCDDWVLQFEYNATSYARALLQIASNQPSSSAFALSAADNKHVLLNRIKRMIERKEKTFFNYRHQLLALIVMTTALSALALFSKKNSVFSVNTKGILTPLVAKVDHPLFNPVFFFLNDDLSPDTAELNKVLNREEKKVALPNKPETAKTLIAGEPEKKYQQLKRSVETVVNNAELIAKHNAEARNYNVRIHAETSDQPGELDMPLEFEEMKNASKELKRFTRVVADQRKDVLLSREQVLVELKKVLLELKDLKVQEELEKMQEDASVNSKNNNRNKEAQVILGLKKQNWQLIANQIYWQLDKAKNEVVNLTNTFNGKDVFQFNAPGTLSLAPAPDNGSHFSFEFSEEHRVRMILPKVTTKRTQHRDKKKIVKGCSCEEETQEIKEVAPPEPVRPLRAARPISIIRI